VKKNILIVTGGAGFIGTNLIKKLLKKTKYKIISLDNYSAGFKKNQIKNKRVKYINGNIIDIKKILFRSRQNIKTIFHFGEFSRIAQSFIKDSSVYETNIKGTYEVIQFCRENKIKIIYSATSASFGNKFEDQHLSPYAFTKTKNLQLILNLNSWENFKYEIIYFYNAYGPHQIKNHRMAAVIGIFENCIDNNKYLPIVRPGTQRRNFTHVEDIVNACTFAFKENKNRQYTVSFHKSYSIFQVAKMFNQKYVLLSSLKGERYKSSKQSKILGKKVYHIKAKVDLKDYINEKYKKNNII
tara:strand:- start:1569 stop:2462 length:894 start_codon:yes stop_codon:yes gene_type:complete